MAKKLRKIYKGTTPIDIITIGGKEPLHIYVTDANKTPFKVYSKQELCTIEVYYGSMYHTFEVYKGESLSVVTNALDNATINNAVVGKYLTQWHVVNNNIESFIIPESSSKIKESLKDIIVNGDMRIEGLYDITKCNLNIYDYSHSTIVKTITVNYNTTVTTALASFNVDTLPAPSINQKENTYSHNGWTLVKGGTIQNTTLDSEYITSDKNIYPLYTTTKIPYKIAFYKYNYNTSTYTNVGNITIYYDESINSAILRGEVDYLNNITSEDLGSVNVFHYTDKLFYSQNFSLDPMNRNTLLSAIPSTYLKSTINLYIGYNVIVKTYSVKLYDTLSKTYLYQNTSVVHGTILEDIQDVSSTITQIKNNSYKSISELQHYNYTYWLEYSNGNTYDTSKQTAVTNNIELHIKYTPTPKVYYISFARGQSLDDYDEFDTIDVAYDNLFGLSNTAKDYVATPIYVKGPSDNVVTFNTTYQSTLDASRKLSGSATLKCINHETFVTTELSRITKQAVIKVYLNEVTGTPYYTETLTSGTNYSLSTAITKAFSYSTSTTSSGIITNTLTDYVLLTATPYETSSSTTYSSQKITTKESFPLANTSGYKEIIIVIKTKQITETVKYTVTYYNADLITPFMTVKLAHGTKYKDIPRPDGLPKDSWDDEFKWWSAGANGYNIDDFPDYLLLGDLGIYPCYAFSQDVEVGYPTAHGVHVYNPTNKSWTQILYSSSTSFSTKTITASTDTEYVIFTIYATGYIRGSQAMARISAGEEVAYMNTPIGEGYWGINGQAPSSQPNYVSYYPEPVSYSHGFKNFTEQMKVTVYLKNTSFNDIAVGESVEYDLSLIVPFSTTEYMKTDGYNLNSACVKLKVTKTDKAQVGGGD